MYLLLAQADAAPGFLSQVQSFFTFISAHWQFCLLHFLEFAIWGAWIVVLANLLNARGFSRKEIGRIYGCMPIGAMITPLFIGPLADKLMNTEVIIGVSHLLGGVLLLLMAKTKNARPFYWLTLLYALAFSPTLGLVNSIVFAHDEDIFGGEAGTGFPWIRVFGTIGWIAAGMSHALLLKKDEPVNERPLLLACLLSFILGIFAFTLPATPPAAAVATADTAAVDTPLADTPVADTPVADTQVADTQVADTQANTEAAGGQEEQIGIIAGSVKMLIEHPIFFGVTFIAAMAMGLYFAFAALFLEKSGVRPGIVGPVMTLGQWIEIFFMLTLPMFLGKDNVNMNWVLLVGITAWALRFGFFAIGKPIALVLLGIAIHGICFDFFFAAGFINADIIAPEGLTATAQTLYGFLVYGLGMYLGSELSGRLNEHFSKEATGADGTTETVTDWRSFWFGPCVIVSVSALTFLASFLL